ncbi:DUF2306 domain-containing protein [Roseobacter litoralis]|uniref:Uncharacterized protein n=1 Tax=Roseobacter litoralis (strain ATCC 49566 / DSM 6996 / JCM 21268 / NBRC 15278 / OCh 149) TaxID=391595 RepID=F7ZGN5_ROSLO|nr:hypothetical protein RLO149_c003050 [Roseobacter litoralis Och 149]
MIPESTKRPVGNTLFVAVLILFALPFAYYALARGMALNDPGEQALSRLFHGGAALSNIAVYGHMIAGGLITALAPLQLSRVLRQRAALLHRILGYVLVSAAVLTSLGGLMYIALQGTIGGPVMSTGFALYGILMLLAAVQTVRYARLRHPLHRLWAERLVILALASWLYRVHYGVWEILTGGLGSRDDFSGPFDVIQVFAFYLPYLALHGWLWRRRGLR